MQVDRRAMLIGAGIWSAAASAAANTTPRNAPTNRDGLTGRDPLNRPLVIAHRGASGDRPEHTMSAYRLAIAQGADFIEPDLVISKDGVLVCRHENEISETTDVAERPEFANRKRTKRVDETTVTGWFAEDFTLAELKSLRCKERLPQVRKENTAFNGREQIPTFEEVVDLALSESVRLKRVIGVYPETKHPSYHRALGLPLEPPLVALLKARGLDRADAPVFIQSFETANLKALRGETKVRLVQLLADQGAPFDATAARSALTYAQMTTDAGLKQIAQYANGVGPHKALIMRPPAAGDRGAPTDLIARAHAEGLLVHAWTFRAENMFLPDDLKRGGDPAQHGDLMTELMRFKLLGVDGWFTDHPAIAATARQTWDT